MSKSSWTQPCCDDCWRAQQPGRQPFRLREVDVEICAWCGVTTMSGIFVRADPATVAYPAIE